MKHLRIIGWFLLGFTVLLTTVLSVFFWWMHEGVFSTEKFDSAKWRARISDQQDATCYRGGMAKDIKDTVVTVGMHKQQVETLLGKPDTTISPSRYDYTLGMCSGWGWDYDNLHIFFDIRDTVIRISITQH